MRAPFSEALLFGIAGGIGIGVFAFFYEREDLATFFVGGRHRWYDDQRHLVGALERPAVAPCCARPAARPSAPGV